LAIYSRLIKELLKIATQKMETSTHVFIAKVIKIAELTTQTRKMRSVPALNTSASTMKATSGVALLSKSKVSL